MYLKVHFGEKPVYLCDEINEGLHGIIHHPDAVFIDELSGPALKSLFHEIAKPDFHAGVVWNADLEALKSRFWACFSIVHAAGGLVFNERDDILMIFRRGSWDLPKGKLDKGETLEACAVREVMEETGLSEVDLGLPLVTTHHTYLEFGKPMLKESHWYNMRASSEQKLKPQFEEDIQGIVWAGVERARDLAMISYPSIRDVMAAAGLIKPVF